MRMLTYANRHLAKRLIVWAAWRKLLPAHHPFGPSRLPLLAGCEGAGYESPGIERETVEGIWGQGMHGASLGETMPDDLDDFDRGAVQRARTWIEAITGGADEVLKEVFVIATDPETGIPINYGTADAIAIWYSAPARALVADLKFYRRPLPAKSLVLQTANYALPILDLFERVDTVGYNPITNQSFSTSYTQAEAEVIRREIKRIIDRATGKRREDLDYRPSLETCSYCPGIGTCSVARSNLPIWATFITYPEKPPALAPKKAEILERVKGMDPGTVVDALEEAQLAGTISEAVIATAREILKSGFEHPVHAVKPAQGARYIDDTAAARKELVGRDGLSAEEFDSCCSASIGKLEDLLKRTAGADLDVRLGTIIKRRDPVYRLVKKGPAVPERKALS